ncbi:hypothetical protein E3O42_16790 [Cryobacterium adonitolivorans]|uniref:Uncharacterized protein n=1 Tax=Cryobacterium adonitolivorans TaxID=1259189 RepID=A0A4R8VZD9_9MICO|nr:hypothetical protein [Cryobacterium adonitolivorans]TFB96794.1 hypothetical protein E3O42_16790 [Cryobacterium adonitolivorans]
MTDTTPPEGNKNHNPDAPTEHIPDDHSPEPTTVADPSKNVDTTVSEPAAEPSTREAAYVPGEPIDYEPATPVTVNASEAPTEKVERLTAEPTQDEGSRDEAVAEQKDYTPTYVPTPAAATTPEAAQPTVQQPTQQQTQQFAPSPVYVTAPTPPKTRGNRAAGILIGLIATAVFALVYALIAFFISASGAATVSDATARFTEFLVLPVYYVPVIFFFLAFALLVAVLNRAGWWAYVLGGFLVAVVVYFSYIGGALLAVQAWNLTPAEAARFVSTQWLNPGAIAAAIVAREVPIWFGAWISRRGRSVTAKNFAAKAEYERQLAEGPQVTRTA